MLSSVRIGENAKNILRDISQQEKSSMQAVLEKAIENYRRQYLLKQTNSAYAKLRNNPTAWEEEINKQSRWEATR